MQHWQFLICHGIRAVHPRGVALGWAMSSSHKLGTKDLHAKPLSSHLSEIETGLKIVLGSLPQRLSLLLHHTYCFIVPNSKEKYGLLKKTKIMYICQFSFLITKSYRL